MSASGYGAGAGGFMSGLIGGIEAGQNIRAKRQMEKAREQMLESGQYDVEAMRKYRKAGDEYGPATGTQDYSGMEDPYLYRLMDWFRGRKRRGSGIDAGMSGGFNANDQIQQNMYEPDIQQYASPPQGYADGGAADLPWEATAEAQNMKGALEEAVKNGKISAEEAVQAAKNPGLLRRVLNSKLVGKAGAAAALASTAGTAALTDTEQYRKRFGLETTDPSFLGDLGVRTLGAASDLGNAMTFGQAGRFYRDLQDQNQPAAPQGAPSALPLSPASPADRTPRTVTAEVTSKRRTALPSAAPTGGPEQIDLSQADFDHGEIPHMPTADWAAYRARMMDAARASGKPEALAQADQAVTGMQQRGFINYAQQGLALQQAGNLRGAMNAFRLAYQYFPNGSDVKFGIYKNHIIGIGIDEKTGQPSGEPTVMDPQRVASIIDNFKSPEAFRHWTTDWHDEAFRQRKYAEIDKPLAQAQADALANNSDANSLRAQLDLERGLNAQGRTPGSIRASEAAYRQRVELLGITDAGKADELAALMSQLKAANPTAPDNIIIETIMRADQSPNRDQVLAQLGLQ